MFDQSGQSSSSSSTTTNNRIKLIRIVRSMNDYVHMMSSIDQFSIYLTFWWSRLFRMIFNWMNEVKRLAYNSNNDDDHLCGKKKWWIKLKKNPCIFYNHFMSERHWKQQLQILWLIELINQGKHHHHQEEKKTLNKLIIMIDWLISVCFGVSM